MRWKKPQGVEKFFNVCMINPNEYSVIVTEGDDGETEVIYGVFNRRQVEEIRRIRRVIRDGRARTLP